MDVLELVVEQGVGRCGELRFPATGCADRERIRIRCRPAILMMERGLQSAPACDSEKRRE